MQLVDQLGYMCTNQTSSQLTDRKVFSTGVGYITTVPIPILELDKNFDTSRLIGRINLYTDVVVYFCNKTNQFTRTKHRIKQATTLPHRHSSLSLTHLPQRSCISCSPSPVKSRRSSLSLSTAPPPFSAENSDISWFSRRLNPLLDFLDISDRFVSLVLRVEREWPGSPLHGYRAQVLLWVKGQSPLTQ